MLFETLGNKKHPAMLFFHDYGRNGGKQKARGGVLAGSLLLYSAHIYGLLYWTKICREDR